MNELNELENFNTMSNPQSCTGQDEYTPSAGSALPYRLKGCRYNIPQYEQAPCYGFKEVLVMLDDVAISSTSPEYKVYLSSNRKEKRFELLVNGLQAIPGMEMQEVGLFLYRENVPEPLWETWEEPDDENDIFVDLNKHLDVLVPGNYFLLVKHAENVAENARIDSMAGHARFSFTVIEDGKELAHPAIVSYHVGRGKERKGASGIIAGCMEFCLELDRKTVKGQEYKMACYNESLCHMGNGCHYIYDHEKCKTSLTIKVESEKMWMPGKYFTILSHNNEPFTRIDFTWDGNSCTSCQNRTVIPGTGEYQLVKPSENEELEWLMIQDLTGITDIKWQILERVNHKLLRRIRSRHGLAWHRENMNFTIAGQDEEVGRKLVKNMPYVLGGNTRRIHIVDARKLVEPKNTVDPYEETTSLLSESAYSTICLYKLDALQFGNGRIVLQKLMDTMSENKEKTSLYLLGTAEEIDRLFNTMPELEEWFPQKNRLAMQSPTLHEFICTVQRKLKENTLCLSPEAQEEMGSKLLSLWNEGTLSGWCEKDADNFIEHSILPGVQQRFIGLLQEGNTENSHLFRTVFPQDIDYSAFIRKQESFDRHTRKLNEMIGLQPVKQNLQRTFNQVRFNKRRKRLGLAAEDESCHHMIFTGNPGTGKTTVAQMIGQIYHDMGLLSKGELVMVERGQIVGRYIGETEKNMMAILEQAKGNVLFIDEAYTLCDGADDRKDFGNHAIECLLTVLARKNPDMLVIMAGYEKEMERMLEANQGLKGRFPHKFHFADYSADELMMIARKWLERKEYCLSEEADRILHDFVSETVANHDRYFSNARWMEQFLSHGLLPAMAERILAEDFTEDKAFYQTILAEDVKTASEKFKPQTLTLHASKRKIGFTA